MLGPAKKETRKERVCSITVTLARPNATQAATRSRTLLSRSRVSRAVEAARRVGGGLIVAAALNASGYTLR